MDVDIVSLSRLQFALTALYHFLFVPLTLGLSILLAIMETVYVMTGRSIWRDMTRFWGTLFGINFAMGVATGIVMEFQFGMNWSYYSHYVGDIFGAPLALEGLMAFFMEATLVGLFFFGWDRLSKVKHLLVTWAVAIGSNYLGTPYAWGGGAPGGFDCSGFVSYVYAQMGISLPHQSGDILNSGTVISASEARPGDILWWPGHVGIYAGNGQVLHSTPGPGVSITNIWGSPTYLRVS